MKITDWLSDLDCEGETHTGKAQNTGLGMFISIALIVFSIFPITGLILSLATLSEIKKGKRLNVNAIIPKITLTVNIIATIACFVGGAIAIYLLG